ncbi:MAG: TIR domain-containing protein, partial [Anaerolineae bacterium]|nr:TIR domain-containing protein [Anaerolineae bacterium]
MADTFNISDAFISYSRRDKPFVQKLEQALSANGHGIWVDWEDIPPTANWWNEIQAGINAADNFIFVISPDSVSSEVCAREVQHAVDQHKRFIPVLYREVVDDSQRAKIHPSVNSHNWIFFRESDNFDAAMQTLEGALKTDLEHVQAHTRYLVKAGEWDSHNRDNSYLLRGTEVSNAENWLLQAEEKLPAPGELHREYILESRRAQNARQRVLLISSLFALIVAVGLLAVAIVQTMNLDQSNKDLADQRDISESNLKRARDTQSLFLTTLSDQELDRGNGQTALLLALESLRFIGEGIYHIQSYDALTNAILNQVQEVAVLRQSGSTINVVGWNDDGTRLLTTGDDGTARVWGQDGNLLQTLVHSTNGITINAGWRADGERIYTWAADEAVVWSADGQELVRLNHDGDVVAQMRWVRDGSRIMTLALPTSNCANDLCTYVMRLWGDDGSLIGTYDTGAVRPPEISWNADWTRVVVSDSSGSVTLDDTLTPINQEAGVVGQGTTWNGTGDRYVTQPTFTMPASLRDSSGQVLNTLTGVGSARDITFSPDSRFALVWSGELAEIWDAGTGELTHQALPLEGTRFEDVYWLPATDAQALLLARDIDCALGDVCPMVLQVITPGGEMVADVLFESEMGASSVTPNPMGNQVLLNACDEVGLYDLTIGMIQTVPIPPGQATDCSGIWSETGLHFYVQWGSVVSLWRSNGSPVDTLEHGFLASNVRWVADGTLVAVTSSIGETQIWDTNGDRLMNYNYGTTTGTLAFNKDITHVVVPTQDQVYLWRLVNTKEPPLDLTRWDGLVWNTDRSLAITWLDDTLYLWQADGTRLRTWKEGIPITDAVFSSDSSMILFVANSAEDCEVDCRFRARVYDVESGTVVGGQDFDSRLAEADFSTDDTRIIVETARRPNCRNVCTTNVSLLSDDGTPLLAEPIDHTDTEDAQIYADQFVVVANRLGTNTVSRVYNSDGIQLAEVTAASPLRSLILTEDGQFALTATGSSRATVDLWQVHPTAWERVATLSDQGEQTTSSNVILLSGDRYMTIANAPTRCDPCDSAVIIWDTAGEQIVTLPSPNRIDGASYNQSTERILTFDDTGMLRIWNASTGEQVIEIPHEVPLDNARWN